MGLQQACGHWERDVEALDGAERHHVAGVRRERFGAAIVYIDVRQYKRATDFPQKRSFLVIGLDEHDGYGRRPELDRDAGEAGTGADVSQRDGRRGHGRRRSAGCNGLKREEVAGCEKAFAEMASDDLLGIADGGQIDAGVPPHQYIDVRRYMGEERSGRRPGVFSDEGGQQRGGPGCVHESLIVDARARIREVLLATGER